MQTVISTFDSRDTAQLAMDRLIKAGFARQAIHLQSAQAGGATGAPGSSRSDDDEGFFASIGDFFSRLFGDDDSSGQAGTYSEAVRRGSTVLAVDVVNDSEAERAHAVMDALETVDVDERAAGWRAEGWTGGVASTSTPASTATGGVKDAQVLNVVQEDLQVGKRTVNRGGVRVVQRVTETPVSELVTLREERATIDRRPVDRPATAADLSAFEEGTIELQETAEEAVVSKSARVVEEVVVGRDVREREEKITDTVRRTDVDVQRTDARPGAAPGSIEDETIRREGGLPPTGTSRGTPSL